MEFVRRVYENSKVTIPKEIRQLHGIREGDFVKLAVVEVIRAPDDAAPLTLPEAARSPSPANEVG